MEKATAIIETNKSVEQVVNNLKKITIQDQPFIKPKGVMFLGTIKENSFKLITFHSPPVEINFLINDETIEFEYTVESLTKTFKGLVYGLGFPIFFAIWLVVFLTDTDVLGKVIATALLLLPLLLNKIINLLYKKYILPDSDKIIKNMEYALEVKIRKKHNS